MADPVDVGAVPGIGGQRRATDGLGQQAPVPVVRRGDGDYPSAVGKMSNGAITG